ncbi:hypothetical protein [Geodermatophilus sp. SYSU D00815]
MASAVLLAGLAAGLSACELPDVTMSPGVEATTTSAAAPTAEVAAQAAARSSTRPAGELDAGSVTHAVAAGASTLVIDYWTAEDATAWTAESAKTIQLSAHLEGGTGAETRVTRFVVTADDGTARTTVTEDRGEFVVTPPFTYGTVLSLTPSTAGATSLTVYVQFDLLVETEEDSGTYFRQTVLDTLQLPLEENPS